ncbi:MAG: GIY-YIG nuclease family protein [Anaerolineae bacterium]
MSKLPTVYILANRRNGATYVGVTSDLVKRIWQHRNDEVDGYTKRYGIHQLVYYETCSDMNTAIIREKQLKHWNRTWKLELIEKQNPEWLDLWPTLVE